MGGFAACGTRSRARANRATSWKAGAEAIFPPGTVIAEAAEKLLVTLNKRLGHAEAAE